MKFVILAAFGLVQFTGTTAVSGVPPNDAPLGSETAGAPPNVAPLDSGINVEDPPVGLPTGEAPAAPPNVGPDSGIHEVRGPPPDHETAAGAEIGSAAPGRKRDAHDGTDSLSEEPPAKITRSGDDVPPHGRYVDDVFSQSRGIRVRNGKLNSHGREVLHSFLVAERLSQRSFIWRELGIEEINFAHNGVTSPVVAQLTAAEDTSPRSEVAQARRTAPNRQELINQFARSNTPGPGTIDLAIRNVAWNIEHLPIFIDSMQTVPWYNDKPGAVIDANVASIDPRYRNSDAVVNYRANAMTLIAERFELFNVLVRGVLLEGKPLDDLYTLQTIASEHVPSTSSDLGDAWYKLIVEEVERVRRKPPIAIDVNVDALPKGLSSELIYQEIYKDINARIARDYHQSHDVADATDILENIGNEETRISNRYTKFINKSSRSRMTQLLQLKPDDPMQLNIESAYRRACARRDMFHEMTIPFVVSDSDPRTYRVHLGDLEERFVDTENPYVSSDNNKARGWYIAAWKRLFEPILKKVISQERLIGHTKLRDIVLAHFHPSHNGLAYVSGDGQRMVFNCDGFENDLAELSMTIAHEYQHVVDIDTNYEISTKLDALLDYNDPSTMPMDRLKSLISHVEDTLEDLANDIEEIGNDIQEIDDIQDHDADLQSLQEQMEDLTSRESEFSIRLEEAEAELDVVDASDHDNIFNYDNDGGFPSLYARESSFENFAEMGVAMRHEPTRITFLRRMADLETRMDAARLKKFYDVMREAMKTVNPHLYKHMGMYYDNLPEERWGYPDGTIKRVDEHCQILRMDHSLASKIAADKLATRLLLDGYDVSMFAHSGSTSSDNRAKLRCSLQSNIKDDGPAHNSRKSKLYIVDSSGLRGSDAAARVHETFAYWTHSGRSPSILSHGGLLQEVHNLNFEKVSVARKMPMTRAEMETDGEFLRNFRKKLGENMPRPNNAMVDARVPSIVANANTMLSTLIDAHNMPSIEIYNDPSMWPDDPNLYRTTIFDGWVINGVYMHEAIDIEEWFSRDTTCYLVL